MPRVANIGYLPEWNFCSFYMHALNHRHTTWNLMAHASCNHGVAREREADAESLRHTAGAWDLATLPDCGMMFKRLLLFSLCARTRIYNAVFIYDWIRAGHGGSLPTRSVYDWPGNFPRFGHNNSGCWLLAYSMGAGHVSAPRFLHSNYSECSSRVSAAGQ